MNTDISTQQPTSAADIPPDDETDVPAQSGDWSRKRALLTGAVVGAFFGIIFFAAYGATAGWICSGRFDCGRWQPIAITSAVGALGFTLFGAAGAYFLHFLYKLFKVT